MSQLTNDDALDDEREAALAALARVAAGSLAASVSEDPASGLLRVMRPGKPALELIEGDIITTPRVWHFDEAPAGAPSDTAPLWLGYLVHLDSAGRATVVRLGDRAALIEAWPGLADLLNPFELASLIARYFGRDAGLPVHHTVFERPADAERLLADPTDLPDKVSSPRMSAPRPDDGLVSLSFFTSFVEPGREGQPTIGLCYWKARWAPELPLAWDSLVIARWLASAWAPG